MNRQDFRIVFMGTPDFAVGSLRALVEGGYNVVAVVTMPDKPVGRHQSELSQSAVKQYAVAHNIPVLQPEKLKDPDFLEELRSYRADLQVIVAFRMLPEAVWDMPPHGTFNLHASLLPQYRGAAPINWAIINGDTETGVTTFLLDHEIDTGRIIHQARTPISEDDNVETVHDRLRDIGAGVVTQTVDDIIAGNIRPIDQDTLTADTEIRHAPKIFKDTCRLAFDLPVKRAFDFVRGMSPYPAAWTELVEENGKRTMLKIYATTREETTMAEAPGTVLTDGKTYFKIAFPDGYLALTQLQLAGKKRMTVSDFLRGYHPEGALRAE
jgi:methionyl-tRNA formyltransferase